MFSIDSIKKATDFRQFQRGRAYCRNGRVRSFEFTMTLKNICTISANIMSTAEYPVSVRIDIDSGKIKDWKCDCDDAKIRLCRHAAAAAIYLCENHPEVFAMKKMSSGSERKIFHEIGLSDVDSHIDSRESDELSIVFTNFNIGANTKRQEPGKMPSARELKFSLMVISIENPNVGLGIDREMMRNVKGQMSLILEYISCNASYQSGEYYFGQLNLDTLLSLASGLDPVFAGDPLKKIEISNRCYVPDVSALTAPDGSVVITDNNATKLIPGKHSIFVLKDTVIMRLSEDIPDPFMYNLNKKIFLDPAKAQIAEKKIFPVLRSLYDIKVDVQNGDGSKVRNIQAKTGIYIVLDDTDQKIYILPQIKYGGFLTINPFHQDYAGDFIDFYNVSPKIKTLVHAKNASDPFFFFRDLDLEYKVYEFFTRWFGGSERKGGRLPVGPANNVYFLFYEIIPLMPPEWDIFYDEKIKDMKPKKSSISFDFDLSSGSNGLLEFRLGFHCDNLKINEKELFEYIMSNKKLLFHEGRFIEVANREKLLSLFKLIGTFGETEDELYSDKLFRISELMPYLKPDSIKDQKDKVLKLIEEAQNKKPLEDVLIHDRFLNILRNYQKDGVLWMHFLRKYYFGGILADDMGLGKTLQSLVMISSFSKDRPSLVICPKTLIYNWAEEAEKFVPDMPIKVIEGSQSVRRHMIKNISNAGLVVTSYPLLQKDIEEYVKIRFEYCIIDEAQKIKNPDTLTAKCVKLIDSEYRLALTGTPLENNLTDLWSIFDFAMPGFLGNESSFKNRFVNLPEQQGNDSLNELKVMIRPFILRRTKTEMLKELPPKIEQACYAQLTKAQLILYMDMLEKIRSEIYQTVSENGFERSQIKILTGLTRLRQICNHPGLINQGLLSQEDISGKMELFVELMEECAQGGHRVLVFSQFVKMLDILQKYLEETGTSFVRLDGKTKDRRSVIERFSDEDDIKVFLISLKAGGLGLNLTSADTVILCDPWWNPMTEEQAMDRAYRIGQKKTVNVYKLITKGTIEEKIQAMQLRKKQLFNSVISESGEYMKKMTWDDVKEILSSC